MQPFVAFQARPDGHFVDKGIHWPLNSYESPEHFVELLLQQ